MRLNESRPSLFGSEEIRRRADNKVELESVDVRVLLAASPPTQPTSRGDGPDAQARPEPDLG